VTFFTLGSLIQLKINYSDKRLDEENMVRLKSKREHGEGEALCPWDIELVIDEPVDEQEEEPEV
jgi:hypothetical protein